MKQKQFLNLSTAEEAEKRVALEEQIKFYEKELNINPLSWGKKKKKR